MSSTPHKQRPDTIRLPAGRPLRVCHVQVLPIMSGVQRAMLEIFEHLNRDRYQPSVVCRDEGPLTVELRRRQIPYWVIPSLVRPLRPWLDWRAYRQLGKLFRQQRFDLVHTHSSKPGALARVAARRAGVPCVVHHVHAFAFHEYSPPHRRMIYGSVERWAGRYCDHVVFVNQEERTLATQQGWLPDEKCSTVYNGVDLACFDPVRGHSLREAFRRRLGAAPAENLILMLGRLEYPKQPLLVADVAAQLQKLRPREAWRIVVVGSGPQEAQLIERIAALRIGRRITLLGWLDEPREALLGADVMLQTSLAEGLPMTLIEAHAAGLASVASDAKGNREVVTPETGVLCPPRDAPSYARQLARLMDDPGLRQTLGTAARRRAEQVFDSRVNNRQVIALYDELLGQTYPSRKAA